MPLCLVIDAETTGIPARGEVVTSPSYPNLVELAGLLIEPDGREVSSFHFVVRPDGWRIGDESSAIHGITPALAVARGVPLALAIGSYLNLRAVADEVAGHNVAFDLGMVSAALHRLGRTPTSPGPTRITCTAELGTAVCGLSPTARMVETGYGGRPKKPSLTELHQHLFGEPFTGTHGALADCRACARCLVEMRRRGLCPNG